MVRTEINEIETEKRIEKINEAKSSFFEKINKIDNLQLDSSRKKERAQINKIRNEKGKGTTNITEIQRIKSDCCEQIYANKMDNLEDMHKFLEMYNLPRLSQEEI